MFSALYNFFLLIVLVFLSPKLLYQILFYKKYRKSILYRLGLRKIFFKKENSRKVFWMHAVSLGESKAGIVLLEKIKKTYPDAFIVFSTITQTGQEEIKQSPLVDLPLYLPLDFSWTMKSLIKKISPFALILVETDFWYHFLKYAKKYNAHVFLVSGVLSNRSKNRYRKIPFFSKRLFSLIDTFCVQNESYAKSFAGLTSNKIFVTGNLKYDQKLCLLDVEEKSHWRKKYKIKATDRLLTIASTHPTEEEKILKALSTFLKKNPSIKILMAPRHPERFSSVKNLIQKEFDFLDIVLIEQMGLLNVCYQLSHLAILGGSFVPKIGGHNILEPCLYQIPVIFGPCMHAQKALEEIVLKYEIGEKSSLDDLAQIVENSFTRCFQKPFQEKILLMKKYITGSSEKTIKVLLENL